MWKIISNSVSASFVASLLVACSAAAPEPSASPNAGTPQPVSPPATGATTASAEPSVAPPPQQAEPPAPQIEQRELGAVEHSLDKPVISLALGQPRVAALVSGGDEITPWLFENGKWRAIAIPERLNVTASDLKTARIYFGRDDKPRIMGARQVEGQVRQLYLRYRGGEWKVEKAEIARLANDPPAAMWGLLGHADPEVVCKQGDQCIIKRLTGWKTMDAGQKTPRVDLSGKEAFALYDDSVAILDGLAWREIAKVEAPRGMWGNAQEFWISSAAKAPQLLHGGAGKLEALPAPVSVPGGNWGSGPKDVWVAGAEGLAHYAG
ncbi:MAG: hypothetical protein AB7S68_13520, partial [Polyangiaceae bacterium]